ncbi:hypothetical protein [Candidatus Williamhamiltonella defendens]|uniref:Uncharacterized protein n=1 Tax=Candidatus Hamiltonella defensa (Bemisia tabaci) TaxID=672795 RepID=A0A249DWQ4_9ENTR|nr:hypothetical protein [Candidatus Hamiltonella defensa]ASX25983.1 hypothetical protein BA171_02285 [Candidatus Hamiltonella defensa (Bemisia tabaci)]
MSNISQKSASLSIQSQDNNQNNFHVAPPQAKLSRGGGGQISIESMPGNRRPSFIRIAAG